MQSPTTVQPPPSKWSFSRILGLLVLIGSVLTAAGGFFDFFHLDTPGWFATILAFIASVTERAQGGANKLAAKIVSGEVTRVEAGTQAVNIATDSPSNTEPFGGQQFR